MKHEIVWLIPKTPKSISAWGVGVSHAEQNAEIFSYFDSPFLTERSDRHWSADGSLPRDLSPTDNRQHAGNLEHPINVNSKCQKIQ